MRAVNILFQGDSLTDSCRAKNVTEPNRGLGDGYVGLIAAGLGCGRPTCIFSTGEYRAIALRKFMPAGLRTR